MKVTFSDSQIKCNKLYCLLVIVILLALYILQTFLPLSSPFEWNGPTAIVKVNLEKSIFTTDEKFLSFGMDSNLIRHRWDTFDFQSKKLKTLAKPFGPAYLRLSGTDGDKMYFAKNEKSTYTTPDLEKSPAIIPDFPFPLENFKMTASDWDSINKFALDVGWRLLFGVNGQSRIINKDDTSTWNHTNTEELLAYTVKKGYHTNIDFEFGNEPESWKEKNKFIFVPPRQLAEEYKNFRKILNTKFDGKFKDSLIAGPATSHTHLEVFKPFLDNLEDNVIHATTWHFYNGAEKEKFVSNYTDPLLLDKYEREAKRVVEAWSTSKSSKVRLWQGEGSSLVRPPGNGIAQSYVASFMLLDKLGLTAKLHMDLIIRQTFYGFWFALVDHKHFPRPNYWIALLFKNIVGRKVLDLEIQMESGNLINKPARLRGYVHCTAAKSGYRSGSVVVYALNIFSKDVKLSFPGALENSNILDQYLLTAPQKNLTSIEIELNGSILKMESDKKLPNLRSYLKRTKTTEVVLPSMGLAYYVFPDVKASPCIGKQ